MLPTTLQLVNTFRVHFLDPAVFDHIQPSLLS